MTATPDCGGFTFAHYREIIERALDLGYAFSTFDGHESVHSERLLLMRHDIDLSLENCRRFARIEHDLGVRAHVLRPGARAALQPVRVHELPGPAGDRVVRPRAGPALRARFRAGGGRGRRDDGPAEKTILEAILDHPVMSASAHLPGKTGTTINDANTASFGIRYDAYSPHFMKDFKYLSDSNGRWREGCLCQHLGSSTGCAC
jgi:hypothetical protein